MTRTAAGSNGKADFIGRADQGCQIPRWAQLAADLPAPSGLAATAIGGLLHGCINLGNAPVELRRDARQHASRSAAMRALREEGRGGGRAMLARRC